MVNNARACVNTTSILPSSNREINRVNKHLICAVLHNLFYLVSTVLINTKHIQCKKR